MTSTRTVKVGLIGLGGMAYAHRHAIAQVEQLKIAAVCDVNEQLLNEIGAEEGVASDQRYKEMEALIADPGVEAVISIVPNDLHAKVLALCLQYHKPVMAEKPFTLNFAEAEALMTSYSSRPIPCMVGFSYRYIPAFRYAKQLLHENVIGTIRHIDVRYLQSHGAPLFQTSYSWRYDKEMSGTGTLGDLGAHMIDSARFFIGEFLTVSAHLATFIPERRDESRGGEMRNVDVDDYASFHAELEHQTEGQASQAHQTASQASQAHRVQGHFVTTRNAVGSGNQHEVSIYGDLGTIHVNCERPDEIRLCVKDETAERPAWRTERVPDEYKRMQLQDFAVLAATGQPPLHTPTFLDGYQNQKVIERIIQSAQRGQTVKIESEL